TGGARAGSVRFRRFSATPRAERQRGYHLASCRLLIRAAPFRRRYRRRAVRRGSGVMADAVLIDTWGWLALGHRRDARHQEVKAFYQALRKQGVRLYTTDYVLDEVISLLFRREAFEESIRFTEGIF